LYAGDSAFFFRIVVVEVPHGMVVALSAIVFNAQIGLHDGPVLIQIVVRLLVQTVGKTLAEKERDP
jgi:hypothetical protein